MKMYNFILLFTHSRMLGTTPGRNRSRNMLLGKIEDIRETP
jgi:hypothetical protein